MTPEPKQTILVVSKEPDLADARAHVLEGAGYRVVSAMDLAAFRKACTEMPKIDLLIIGYSLPPSEKRRVFAAAKECGKAPVTLELYKDGRHDLLQSDTLVMHQSETPTDFLEAVNHILRTNRRDMTQTG